jgi:hypothetical protein
MASSLRLKPTFEIGSGDDVTAARIAVFPPWAARAITPPSKVANHFSLAITEPLGTIPLT